MERTSGKEGPFVDRFALLSLYNNLISGFPPVRESDWVHLSLSNTSDRCILPSQAFSHCKISFSLLRLSSNTTGQFFIDSCPVTRFTTTSGFAGRAAEWFGGRSPKTGEGLAQRPRDGESRRDATTVTRPNKGTD